jgi:serine/threonine-protein kinase
VSPTAGVERLVAGRYALERRLGAGGMAEVYLARDLQSGRRVALKLLGPPLAADPRVVARFEHEARAAAAIAHPNVVAVHGHGVDDGTHYIEMEYVPGPNLKELLRERGPLSEDEGLRIGQQVANALEAAHAHGVVHLDVKPHNVLLAPDGRVKVTDFGIARALQAGAADATLTTPLGSAPYVSPEQAQGRRVDARSDLYSLGALLYELLTGRPPFEGDSPLAVVLRHLNETPRPPRALRPELSGAAEAIVLRALAKDPAARFASAAEMGAGIAAARQGQADPGLESTRPLALPPLETTQPLPRTAAPPPTFRPPASTAASPGSAAAAGAGAAAARRRWLPIALALALLGAGLLALPRLLASAPLAAPRERPAPAATAAPIPTAVPSPTTPPTTATAVPPTPTKLPPTPTRPPPTATRPPATATPPPPTATQAPPAKAPVVDRNQNDKRDRKPKSRGRRRN